MRASDVRIASVDPRLIAAVRLRTTRAGLAKSIRTGLDQVWPQIKDRSGRNVVLYHPSGPDGLGEEFDIETGVEVPTGFEPASPVYLTRTPGGRVVTTAHLGSYAGLDGAYDAIREYVRANRVRVTGPSWEIYGHWNADADKLRTDVFFAIASGGSPKAAGR
jgi:effector-binding domain-containing protein